jgi:hypothetical protein
MDAKERELFISIWRVLLRQNELLQMILPTTHDVARCLIDDRKPNPQQVGAWTELNKRVTQEMLDINAALAELQRSVDPLIGYDS